MLLENQELVPPLKNVARCIVSNAVWKYANMGLICKQLNEKILKETVATIKIMRNLQSA